MITRRELGIGIPGVAALAQQSKLKVGVVGAGVFGAWISHQLQSAGCSVTLFDQYGPGNARASSGGESRLIRAGYGPSSIYSEWAIRSLQLWTDAFRSLSHTECFVPTGLLWLVAPDDPYGVATLKTLKGLNWPFEVFDRAELQRRYPMIQAPAGCHGVLEPRAGALLARRAVAAVFADFVNKGGTFVPAKVSLEGEVLVAGEQKWSFDRIVIAAGPWLPKVLPTAIGKRLTPTRQEILFFGPPAGSQNYAVGRLPGWLDFTDSRMPYGFPDIESRGFKMAFDRHGETVDPDTQERVLSGAMLKEAREYLEMRFPEIAKSPLVESRVCQYENTDSGDFIMDWHPESKRVFLAGGGSGHGFKHGPAVGEHVAKVLTGQEPLIERFSIANATRSSSREVH
jgi:glycine/D-amino acid oxidase-like deaminating enzyme